MTAWKCFIPTLGSEKLCSKVQEQFGYFTPSEFIEFVYKIFEDKAKIVELKHYLQDGYEEYLLQKVDIFDETIILQDFLTAQG